MVTVVFIHGAGEETSDGQPWVLDIARSLERVGYAVDRGAIQESVVSPTYTTHLQEHVPVDRSKKSGDHPHYRPGISERHRQDFEHRQDELAKRLPTPFPVSGVARGAIKAASRSPWVAKKFADVLTSDASLYSRDAARRSAVRSAVQRSLVDTGDDVLLIGHSLGSVIALDLLTHLPRDVNVVGFVTIGSPLGTSVFSDLLSRWAPAFPYDLVDSWVNFFDPDDSVTGGSGIADAVVAAGGPRVVDHVVENGGLQKNHGSGRYLDQLVVAHHLGPRLIDDHLPNRPQLRDHLQESIWFDAALRKKMRRTLIEAEQDLERRARMEVVDLYLTADAVQQLGIAPTADLALAFEDVSPPSGELRRQLLMELVTSQPFAPFEISIDVDARHAATLTVANQIGVGEDEVLRAVQAVKTAMSQLDSSNPYLGAAIVTGVLVVAAAAPFAVAAAGAAGTAGAAALTSGLATLGGGSMATGLAATAATGAVTTGAAAFALERMSADEAIDSVFRLFVDALWLSKSGRSSEAQEVFTAIRNVRYEARRMSREHSLLGEHRHQAKAYRKVEQASGRAIDYLLVQLFDAP